MTEATVIFKRSEDDAHIEFSDSAEVELRLLELFADTQLIHSGDGTSVWKIKQGEAGANHGRCVAKVFGPHRQAAYRREAAVALHLRSPYVIKCLDTRILSSGHSVLIYEYMNGGSVSGLCTAGLLQENIVHRILAHCLYGLIDLHEHGYIHCDIKPSNILCTADALNDNWSFKIADLGSVAAFREARAGIHTNGSPAYSAPERLHGGFDASSDIYSLGIIAFELLYGQLPFIGSVEEIYRAHLARPLPLEEIESKAWREWIARACAKRPQDRFPSVQQAIAVLPTNALSTSVHDILSIATDKTTYQSSTFFSEPEQFDKFVNGTKFDGISFTEEPEQVSVDERGVFLGMSSGIWCWWPSVKTPVALTASVAPFFLHSSGVAFISEGQLLVVDPLTRKRHRLSDTNFGETILSFAYNGKYLAVAQARRVLILDLLKDEVIIAVRHKHYAMQPAVAVDTNSFVVSGGLANQEIWWRNFDGDLLMHWRTDGPVLELRLHRGRCYASVALVNGKGVCIWTLEPGRQPIQVGQQNGSLIVALGQNSWIGFDAIQNCLIRQDYSNASCHKVICISDKPLLIALNAHGEMQGAVIVQNHDRDRNTMSLQRFKMASVDAHEFIL